MAAPLGSSVSRVMLAEARALASFYSRNLTAAGSLSSECRIGVLHSVEAEQALIMARKSLTSLHGVVSRLYPITAKSLHDCLVL